MNDKPAATAGEDFDLEALCLKLDQTANLLQAISEAMFYSPNEPKFFSPGIVHCSEFLLSLVKQIEDYVDFTYRSKQ